MDIFNKDFVKYVWDDFSKYPLDLILLNSSQHSEGNLEWMMMTFLLMNVLADNEKYYLCGMKNRVVISS